ncbi:TrkH family potassium uptake protein [Hespellia stercorisuis]|uniref:TrkH family potassium uptake protein n=1 Tax=Hespellia stercorisuis TaxID=180311 RepID=UPI002E8E3788|nr:potassium transporter TrkG [Hespellia stercorisuis]
MKDKKRKIRLNTMQLIALGFFGVIFLGGILLWLPWCNEQPIRFIDAMFTSVTAVCVTGLVTITPATQFTLLGKVILLILIQIGGVGVIACTIAFFVLLKKRITIRERAIIQQAYSMENLSGMVKFILRIIKGTLVMEFIGGVLFALEFVPDFGWVRGIWYSVFHSISAFCNAGIDILGTDSMIHYQNSVPINIAIMGLIVFGGLGFVVWYDVGANIRRVISEHQPLRRMFTRLQLQSKVVLVMTATLILIGAACFLGLEHNNPETMQGMSWGNKIMASFFQSVTTRTAGFATISQDGLTSGSKLVGCILMFIGGSPGGTAGGVKTTTVALLLILSLSVIRGSNHTECFGRKIARDVVRTGTAIVLITFITLMAGVVAITILEPKEDFLRILYEATSAMATVGLTADLTPQLCDASHVILMIMMYIGRIGPITMALVFGGKGSSEKALRDLPEKRIMVG